MKSYRACVLLLFLGLLYGCHSEQSSAPDTNCYVTVDEIRQSLPDTPVSVGFDVDDTLLFSSPGFYYGLHNTDGPDGANKYGQNPLRSYSFWYDMNSQFDKFSIPKLSALALINMHKQRGDTIYFITARQATSNEYLTTILTNTFNLPDNPSVIFSGSTSKAIYIKNNAISLFYGDSDGDISAAHDAGIRAIRVLRPVLSTNARIPNPGKFNEEILAESLN